MARVFTMAAITVFALRTLWAVWVSGLSADGALTMPASTAASAMFSRSGGTSK